MTVVKEDQAETTSAATADLVAAAEALVPVLRERSSEADDLRRLPDATIADFLDAGLLQMHTPKAYGGPQLDLDTHLAVFRTVARGCVSSAWVGSFLAQHNAWVARFGQETQEALYETKGYCLLSGSNQARPGAGATRVEGGYRVSGRWGFNSGIMHASHAFLMAPLDGDAARRITTVIPRDQLEIPDNWDTYGMRATGSGDVIANDVFVPDLFAMETAEFFSASNPGALVHPDYQLIATPVQAMVSITAMAYVLGAADRTMEIFKASAPKRRRPWREEYFDSSPMTQSRYAEAALKLHTADLLAAHELRVYFETYGKGQSQDQNTQALAQLDTVGALVNAGEAVELLARRSGGSIFARGNELGRIFRDVQVLLAHSLSDWDSYSEYIGRILIGHDALTGRALGPV